MSKIHHERLTDELRATPVSRWRQQQLSNEKIAFFICLPTGELHDKHCKELGAYRDADLEPVEAFDRNYRMCEACAVRAYIRAGARDYAQYKQYIAFFKQAGATVKQIRRLYAVMECETWLSSPTCMGLSFWDDRWQIAAVYKQAVQLRHNNYHAHSDGTREFTREYHIQQERCSFSHALDVIWTYHFDTNHITRLRQHT
ncbi:MAG: hypothetical protein LUG57_04120 [Oscillospiraceae bacterium]|nr:hypothetical protein [Oscillospiraceae bacterium]